MITRINEIFSSIQGEGRLIGRRQIFIRFSGCNLTCNYCDSPQSRNMLTGREYDVHQLYQEIKKLKTPDFHSISLTGGEPLLHADFIHTFLNEYDLKALLETNGSLPGELNTIVDLIDYASVDIKLPEHNATPYWEELWSNELESVNLLIEEGINTYCKMVISPVTRVDMMGHIASKMAENLLNPNKISMIIQPKSPLQQWVGEGRKLLNISEEVGKHFDVFLIPQIHPLLKLR